MSNPGPSIGKYRLVAELARGGMGHVYLAVSPGLGGFNKLLVLKTLRPELQEDEYCLSMFLDEARLAARLAHPNIVQTYEVGADDEGLYYMAMEYLEGQPLNRIRTQLLTKGKLPLTYHLRVVVDSLAGLHYAHELQDFDGSPLKVVHRDVSPHNLFVTYEGQVKLVDFGIAKALDASQETRAGVLKGKVAYMAPEQAKGEAIDRRADIFSAGVILWEAATGRRFWRGVSDVQVLRNLVEGNYPKLKEAAPKAHPRLIEIIDRAIAFHRDQRYPTAAELQADLEEILPELGTESSARALSKLLATEFNESRGRVKGVVDQQIRQLRSEANSGSFSVVSVEQYLVGSRGRASTLTSFSGMSSQGGVAPAEMINAGAQSVSGSQSGTHSNTETSMPTSTGTASSISVVEKTGSLLIRGRSEWIGIATAAAVFAVGAVGLYAWQKRGAFASVTPPVPTPVMTVAAGRVPQVPPSAATNGTTTTAASAPAPTPPAAGAGGAGTTSAAAGTPAAGTAPAAEKVRFVITAAPPSAEIWIDGSSTKQNTLEGEYPKGSTHKVTIRAPGYSSQTKELVFDRDFQQDFTLAKAAPKPAGRGGGSDPLAP